MKARRTVDRKMQERIRKEVAGEMLKQTNDITTRVFKMFCVALHMQYGFGKIRIQRVLDKIEEIAKERDHDEVFWSHMDIYCKHLGFEFKDENYERMDS